MIRTSFQVLVGVLLVGCTFNTYTTTSYDAHPGKAQVRRAASAPAVETKENKQASKTPVVVNGNKRIRPGCIEFVPLPVPEPVKVDLKELEAAQSPQEINVIALRNVKALHRQMTNYAAEQKKYYDDYVKRCVIR